MFSENNKKVQPKTKTKHTLFQKSSREWHHHHLVLLLGMFGSGMLFLFVLVAYFATRPPSEELYVSKYFTYSTALLLFSSYPISRLTVSFDKEKGRQILKSLMVSAFAGSIFILLQLAGWKEMNDTGFSIDHRSSGFLYVLSGLHIVHVLVVVLVNTVLMYRTTAKLIDPISSLVYYTNPYQRLVLQMMTQSWWFLHAIWLFIYLTFVSLNS